MLAIREQLIFAAGRCENFGTLATSMSEIDRNDPFSALAFIDLREYCAIQIHAARLQMIEYGQSKGVNPFR